jgi:hypothetical protein
VGGVLIISINAGGGTAVAESVTIPGLGASATGFSRIPRHILFRHNITPPAPNHVRRAPCWILITDAVWLPYE